MLNIVIISGRLVRDPELKEADGQKVLNFSIAHNRKYKVHGEPKDEVSYFDCVAFKQTAELIATHLEKGSSVVLAGRLVQQTYEKDGKNVSRIKLIVNTVQFTGPKKGTGTDRGEDSWLQEAPPEQ